MGFIDMFKGLFGKGEELAKAHPDQLNQAIAKAEGLVDDKTGHKFSAQIQAGGAKAAQFLDGGTTPPPTTPPAEH